MCLSRGSWAHINQQQDGSHLSENAENFVTEAEPEDQPLFVPVSSVDRGIVSFNLL